MFLYALDKTELKKKKKKKKKKKRKDSKLVSHINCTETLFLSCKKKKE